MAAPRIAHRDWYHGRTHATATGPGPSAVGRPPAAGARSVVPEADRARRRIRSAMPARAVTAASGARATTVNAANVPRLVAPPAAWSSTCLLYTSDAADEEDSVDLGGRRIIKKKKNEK